MKVLQAADKLPGGKIGVTDAEGDAVVPGAGHPRGTYKALWGLRGWQGAGARR